MEEYMIKKTILFLLVLLLIVGCKNPNQKDKKGGPNVKSTDNVETIFAVNTTKVVKGEINDYLELNGDIKTKREVAVYPDTMGKLITLNVRVGQYVQKGDVIAEVDPSKPGMEYQASPVKAAISGTITEVPAQIGATVTLQSPIVKIGVLYDVDIVSYVAEKYISKIKIGLPVFIKLEAYPEVTFKGYLSEISPVIDPQSRMLEIKISLNERDTRVKPGMFAKLKIVTEKKTNIVKIPDECIVKRYGEFFVFVIKDNTTDSTTDSVEKRKITSGIQIDNKIEIVQGLSAKEEVVIRGQTLLEDKTKVKIVDRIEPLSVKDNIE
ncbi:MAG: hypothetical protein A2086_13240 [Spirochaetes bacterium GWD1_27_9]|nr:MAG: hypothetical protein A2Z98_02200 [Spirochaetes bacterium GWB1_27_13]OHD25920.1 MAG: hypothetical protein A2Y34_14215 [Spirochaetes bacterium GWC1_27_15]OHD44889.1 MAG: hypothetical protein A2086_13240 [Spirochaetes bacterium GWD1_27_9]